MRTYDIILYVEDDVTQEQIDELFTKGLATVCKKNLFYTGTNEVYKQENVVFETIEDDRSLFSAIQLANISTLTLLEYGKIVSRIKVRTPIGNVENQDCLYYESESYQKSIKNGINEASFNYSIIGKEDSENISYLRVYNSGKIDIKSIILNLVKEQGTGEIFYGVIFDSNEISDQKWATRKVPKTEIP